MIESGNFIDNYRLLNKISERNLSAVYLAEHTSVGAGPVLLTLWHGITFTTSEDIQLWLQKARPGVILRQAQSISLLAAQVYQQSPYIVTEFNEEIRNLLNTYLVFVDYIVDATAALHPYEPHSSIDTFLSLFDASPEPNEIDETQKQDEIGEDHTGHDHASAPDSASNTDQQTSETDSSSNNSDRATNPAFARTVPQTQAGLRQQVQQLWGQKPQRKTIYRVASIVLFLALLGGSVALLIIFLPASTAMVTITPMSERMTAISLISLVDGTSSVNQISQHTMSYTTPEQSRTVPATGKKHQDATQAQGKVVISQIHLFSTANNGDTINASNIKASNGTLITVESFTATEGGTVTVEARASQDGQGGNIPAYDINGTYTIVQSSTFDPIGRQIGTAYLQNPNAFAGGQDAVNYVYVQQIDIYEAAGPLSTELTASARQKIQQQLQPDEQLVQDIMCNDSMTSNHKAEEAADSVTVTVNVTCSGVAYKKQDFLAAAINAHRANAIAELGTGYQLSGDITVDKPMLIRSDQNAPIVYEVTTHGVWVFQIDAAQQQEIARSIAGRPRQDAIDQLRKRKGVKDVVITTGGSIGTALPTSPASIKLNVLQVPGLTAT